MNESRGSTVSWRKDGWRAIIELNRPDKLNCLGLKDFSLLSSALRDIAQQPDIVVTVIAGTGRFFSAGADIETSRPPKLDEMDRDEAREHMLRVYAALALDLTRSFYTHPKILVAALNGPAVGLAAGPLGFCDFVYAAPHAYLLTPFSSLGLIVEGGATIGLVQRMGIAKANEALIASKKITCEELSQCGFVNKVLGKEDDGSDVFLQLVLKEIQNTLGEHLDPRAMLQIKSLIRKPFMDTYALSGLLESMHGIDQLMTGAPAARFDELFRGQKRHKL